MAMSQLVSTVTLSDRIMQLMERVDYRRAETDEDKEAIYRLRYAVYLQRGAVEPHASQRYVDKHDDTPNCSVFGVFVDGELASSLRLHIASPERGKMPATDVFPDLVREALAGGKTIVEQTRYVADMVLSRRFPELSYVTMRVSWLACEYFGAHQLLAAVGTEQQAFYRRVFGHRPISEPRHHPLLIKPVLLMAVDYPSARQRVLHDRAYLRSTFFERRMLFGYPPPLQVRSAA